MGVPGGFIPSERWRFEIVIFLGVVGAIHTLYSEVFCEGFDALGRRCRVNREPGLGVGLGLVRLKCAHVVRPHFGRLNPSDDAAARGCANGCDRKESVESGSLLSQCRKGGHVGGGIAVNRQEQGLVFADQPDHRSGVGCSIEVHVLGNLTTAKAEGQQHCGTCRPPLLRVVRRCRFVGVILRAHHSVCAQITVAEFESTPRRSYGSASSRVDWHGVGPVNRKRLIHLTWS